MTTVILSGWESGSSASGAEQVNFTSGTFSLSTTTVRTGAYALRSNPTTTAVGRVDMQVLNANGALTTTGPADAYARFYFRYAVKPSANDEPIYSVINTSSAFKAELRINSAGNLVLYNQALSLIGTGAVALAADTWYRVELRTGTGTGANYELIINGASELSGTMDQTTLNHGTFRFGKVTNRNGNTVDFFYDDIRIDDAAFPGPGQISKISPNANGSTMQWSGGTGASDYT